MAPNRRYGYVEAKRTCSQCGDDCSGRGEAIQGGNGKWRCRPCVVGGPLPAGLAAALGAASQAAALRYRR
jgi:hypothetical protein